MPVRTAGEALLGFRGSQQLPTAWTGDRRRVSLVWAVGVNHPELRPGFRAPGKTPQLLSSRSDPAVPALPNHAFEPRFGVRGDVSKLGDMISASRAELPPRGQGIWVARQYGFYLIPCVRLGHGRAPANRFTASRCGRKRLPTPYSLQPSPAANHLNIALIFPQSLQSCTLL
jgi:hypothetical protein